MINRAIVQIYFKNSKGVYKKVIFVVIFQEMGILMEKKVIFVVNFSTNGDINGEKSDLCCNFSGKK